MDTGEKTGSERRKKTVLEKIKSENMRPKLNKVGVGRYAVDISAVKNNTCTV